MHGRDLCSSGMLRIVCWQFSTDVSVKYIGLISWIWERYDVPKRR